MTRKVFVHVFILSLFAVPIVSPSLANPPGPYDRANETSVSGTIVGVDAYVSADGAVGVHFDLNTGTTIVRVHVGPARYIGGNNFYFLADDRVTIIGARVSHDGNRVIWARAIQKGALTLVLRSEDGTPKWAPATDGADGCGVDHPALPRTTERH